MCVMNTAPKRFIVDFGIIIQNNYRIESTKI